MSFYQKLDKAIFRRARQAIRNLFKPTIIQIKGVKISLNGLSAEMKSVLYSERYETKEHYLVSMYLRPGERFLEVGAGLGYITTVAAKRTGSSNVTAVEANLEMIPRIKETLRLNNVNANLVNCAVGKENGIVNFNISSEFWSSSKTIRVNTVSQVQVQQKSFECLIREVEPAFILLDIEGGEVELLEACIPSCVRKIAIERHAHVTGITEQERVKDWIISEGFKIKYDFGDQSMLLAFR